MHKRIISLVVVASCAIPGQRAQAQTAQTVSAAISACQAAPAACAVVGAAAGTYLYWKYGPKLFCPTYGNWCQTTGRTPSQPREMRSQVEQQQFGVTSPDKCQNVVRRLRSGGYQARLLRAIPNNIGSGGVLKWLCIIETDAPKDFYPRFNDRYGRDR